MLYEYECAGHGVFEANRPARDFASPAPCPACGRDAPRIVSLPAAAGAPRAEVVARDRNERSRHAPALVVREEGRPRPGPSGVPTPRVAASRHPWMVGHG
jgi:putative FmdB family regulatory protein